MSFGCYVVCVCRFVVVRLCLFVFGVCLRCVLEVCACRLFIMVFVCVVLLFVFVCA